jgi:rhodanese-related sulfurtransferase
MKEISVEALKAKLDNREDFIFIDVREPYEFEEFNLGARLIPLVRLWTIYTYWMVTKMMK